MGRADLEFPINFLPPPLFSPNLGENHFTPNGGPRKKTPRPHHFHSPPPPQPNTLSPPPPSPLLKFSMILDFFSKLSNY